MPTESAPPDPPKTDAAQSPGASDEPPGGPEATEPAAEPEVAEAPIEHERTEGAQGQGTAHAGHHVGGTMGALALGALGVVFGDIGTSPLYALKECVADTRGAIAPEDILGILSLILWSLTMVVAVKYLTFIMRADNRGEGGILALLALVPERLRPRISPKVGWVAALVLFGAALLYGDGVITPAISVLSAVEGLEAATTALKPLVVPVTCLILLGLFLIQRRGTQKVGRLFGPVMVVWFATLAVLGVVHIVGRPSVFVAIWPGYAVGFFAKHGLVGMKVLGAVVLTLTGGEALYADMGHFGKRPIQLAWYGLVMPALVLNYFGQGALLLARPEAASHPFYALVPSGVWTYALVILSTFATIIASQALISGAFSLTHQAVQLGYFPRVTIRHTSKETEGQIYVPEINAGLAVACLVLVLMFKESGRLAAAYGLAVTGTMAITSVVFYVVMRETWRWPAWRASLVVALFLSFDIPFLLSNLIKFVDGGYVPVAIGAALFAGMLTWKKGRAYLAMSLASRTRPVDGFLSELETLCGSRVPGTWVFLTSSSGEIPVVLLHQLRTSRVLSETVVLMTVTNGHVPTVDESERIRVSELGKGLWRVVASYGFMEQPDVPGALSHAVRGCGLPGQASEATYFIGRETLLATDEGQMGRWSETLFSFLSRNARSASSYFQIPPEHVVELGVQLDL